VCCVHWLCGTCTALRRCLRFLFCVRSFCLSSPVTSAFVSSRRGWSRPSFVVTKSATLMALISSFILALTGVRLKLFVFLPCPPYINSVLVLKMSLGGLSLSHSCIFACSGPVGSPSATSNVLMNLLTMTVSMGPNVAAIRFFPGERNAPPPNICLSFLS